MPSTELPLPGHITNDVILAARMWIEIALDCQAGVDTGDGMTVGEAACHALALLAGPSESNKRAWDAAQAAHAKIRADMAIEDAMTPE